MSEAERELRPIVYVVDDDESVRGALANLLDAVNLDVEIFASAEDFLSRELTDRPSCVILDVRLPGVSGLTIQGELAGTDAQVPIIFLTGHADVPMTVRAMKAGAVDFLTKPFREQELLDAVQSALRLDQSRRAAQSTQASLRAGYDRLTDREREIMALVSEGLMNKEIAHRIGIAEITVKIHRGKLSRKLGVRSVAELVKVQQALASLPPRS